MFFHPSATVYSDVRFPRIRHCILWYAVCGKPHAYNGVIIGPHVSFYNWNTGAVSVWLI